MKINFIRFLELGNFILHLRSPHLQKIAAAVTPTGCFGRTLQSHNSLKIKNYHKASVATVGLDADILAR